MSTNFSKKIIIEAMDQIFVEVFDFGESRAPAGGEDDGVMIEWRGDEREFSDIFERRARMVEEVNGSFDVSVDVGGLGKFIEGELGEFSSVGERLE